MDVSAIEFNKKNNMDWNKWINQGRIFILGVPYIDKKKYKKFASDI